MAKLFITRHARPNNRSWKEAARLLGLRPSQDNRSVAEIVAEDSKVVRLRVRGS
jgi:hypothetical protein